MLDVRIYAHGEVSTDRGSTIAVGFQEIIGSTPIGRITAPEGAALRTNFLGGPTKLVMTRWEDGSSYAAIDGALDAAEAMTHAIAGRRGLKWDGCHAHADSRCELKIRTGGAGWLAEGTRTIRLPFPPMPGQEIRGLRNDQQKLLIDDAVYDIKTGTWHVDLSPCASEDDQQTTTCNFGEGWTWTGTESRRMQDIIAENRP